MLYRKAEQLTSIFVPKRIFLKNCIIWRAASIQFRDCCIPRISKIISCNLWIIWWCSAKPDLAGGRTFLFSFLWNSDWTFWGYFGVIEIFKGLSKIFPFLSPPLSQSCKYTLLNGVAGHNVYCFLIQTFSAGF